MATRLTRLFYRERGGAYASRRFARSRAHSVGVAACTYALYSTGVKAMMVWNTHLFAPFPGDNWRSARLKGPNRTHPSLDATA